MATSNDTTFEAGSSEGQSRDSEYRQEMPRMAGVLPGMLPAGQ